MAVFKGHPNVNEIYIEGDCVWGIFDTPLQFNINQTFGIGFSAASLVDILNIKLRRYGYSQLSVGIGMSYGESLLIKAGYKGSGINEVVWLGKLVGEAAELCSNGNKGFFNERIMVSEVFYNNLNDHNKGLLSWNGTLGYYHGNVVNSEMNGWVLKNG